MTLYLSAGIAFAPEYPSTLPMKYWRGRPPTKDHSRNKYLNSFDKPFTKDDAWRFWLVSFEFVLWINMTLRHTGKHQRWWAVATASGLTLEWVEECPKSFFDAVLLISILGWTNSTIIEQVQSHWQRIYAWTKRWLHIVTYIIHISSSFHGSHIQMTGHLTVNPTT